MAPIIHADASKGCDWGGVTNALHSLDAKMTRDMPGFVPPVRFFGSGSMRIKRSLIDESLIDVKTTVIMWRLCD